MDSSWTRQVARFYATAGSPYHFWRFHRPLSGVRLWLIATLFFALISPGIVLGQDVIFVDQSATGSNTGTSWHDAFVSLQDALISASSGSEIWVAAGAYTPDIGTVQIRGDQEVSFTLSQGVMLFGGFDGTEVRLDERDWERNLTILSGDLLADDQAIFDPTSTTRNDNSNTVLSVSSSVDNPAPVVDGFQIVSGHATDIKNYGGGISIQPDSHVELRNILFEHNYAEICGGGLASFGTFRLSDSRFFQNAAGVGHRVCAGGNGGALYHSAYPEAGRELPAARIDNVSFEDNAAVLCGGALAVYFGPFAVTNTRFLENHADLGGAVCVWSQSDGHPIHFANTQYIGNVAANDGGGALYGINAEIIVFNSLFNGNSVDPSAAYPLGGAIMVIEWSKLSLINTTVTNNSALRAGAIMNSQSSIEIANSIIWDNTTQEGHPLGTEVPISASIQHSITSGGSPPGYDEIGSGIIDDDPLFFDAIGPDNLPGTIDDDLRLGVGSPGIDKGANNMIPDDIFDLDGDGDLTEQIPIDLDGNIRVSDGGSGFEVVDLGPYEFSAVPNATRRHDYDPALDRMQCGMSIPFPNPMADRSQVVVFSQYSRSVKLDVYDSLGRHIYTIYSGLLDPLTRHTFGIDSQLLSSGNYHIQLSESTGTPLCGKNFIVRK